MFDVCLFPWCRKVKHLLHHLVTCQEQEYCSICSPTDLTPNFSALRGLNEHRFNKLRERLSAKAQITADVRAKASYTKPTESADKASKNGVKTELLDSESGAENAFFAELEAKVETINADNPNASTSKLNSASSSLSCKNITISDLMGEPTPDHQQWDTQSLDDPANGMSADMANVLHELVSENSTSQVSIKQEMDANDGPEQPPSTADPLRNGKLASKSQK